MEKNHRSLLNFSSNIVFKYVLYETLDHHMTLECLFWSESRELGRYRAQLFYVCLWLYTRSTSDDFALHAVLALLINEWMSGLLLWRSRPRDIWDLWLFTAKLKSWQPWSKNRLITSSAELKTSLHKGNLHWIHSSESDFAFKIGDTQSNETVSLGDTAISLHTLPVVTFLGGGVYSWLVKTQSAKF